MASVGEGVADATCWLSPWSSDGAAPELPTSMGPWPSLMWVCQLQGVQPEAYVFSFGVTRRARVNQDDKTNIDPVFKGHPIFATRVMGRSKHAYHVLFCLLAEGRGAVPGLGLNCVVSAFLLQVGPPQGCSDWLRHRPPLLPALLSDCIHGHGRLCHEALSSELIYSTSALAHAPGSVKRGWQFAAHKINCRAN